MRRIFAWALLAALGGLAAASVAQTYVRGRIGAEDMRYSESWSRVVASAGDTLTMHGIQPLNALAWGVTGNGTTDDADSLNVVSDSLNARGGGAILLPEGNYLIDTGSTFTLDSGVALWMTPGAKFVGGGTLVFDGPVLAGLYPIIADTMTITGQMAKMAYVPPEWFGAVVNDGTSDTDEIEAAAGVCNAVRFSPGNYFIASGETLSVADSVGCWFSPGAMLNGSGVVDIDGPVYAPLDQIFSSSLTISGGLPKAGTLYPEWFGAAGDGSTNDHAEVSAAITAATNAGKGVVYFGSPLGYAGVTQIQISDSDVLLAGPSIPDSIGAGAPRVLYGSGAPDASVWGPVGSVYQRSDGSTSTSLYVKTSGDDSVGWSAIAPAGGDVTMDSLTVSYLGATTTAINKVGADSIVYDAQGHPASPRVGTMVYDTGSLQLHVYDGSEWDTVLTTGGAKIAQEKTYDSKTLDSAIEDYVAADSLVMSQVEEWGGAREGTAVYDATDKQMLVYDGSAWRGPNRAYVRIITAADSLTPADQIVVVDGISANTPIKLGPAADLYAGKMYTIFKRDPTATDTVFIDPAGSETINGAAADTLTAQFDYVDLISDGYNWLSRVRAVAGDPGAPSATDVTPPTMSFALSAVDTTNADDVMLGFYFQRLSEVGLARFQWKQNSGGTWAPSTPIWAAAYEDTSSYRITIYDTLYTGLSTADLAGDSIYVRGAAKDQWQNTTGFGYTYRDSTLFTRATPPAGGGGGLTGAAGDTIVLVGTGFGAGDSVAVWDDGTQGTADTDLEGQSPLIGPAWYTESTRTGGTPVYKTTPIRYTGAKSILSNFWKSTDGGSDNYRSAIVYEPGSTFTQAYATWWVYYDPDGTDNRTEMYKMCRIEDSDAYPGNQLNAYMSYTSNCDTSGAAFAADCISYVAPMSSSHWNANIGKWFPTRDWFRVEVYLKMESNPPGSDDAEFKVWYVLQDDSPAGGSAHEGRYNMMSHSGNFVTESECSAGDYTFDKIIFNYYHRNHFSDYPACDVDGTNDTGANVYFSDLYISPNQARVEMGNKSTWAACTLLEVQPYVYWAADGDSVQFIAHPGNSYASGDTSYVYIVKQDGSATASGEMFVWE